MKTLTIFFSLLWVFTQLLGQTGTVTLLDDPSVFGKTSYEKEASFDHSDHLYKMKYFGYLYEGEDLNKYLNGILEKLMPEEVKSLPISLYVSNSTIPNAYAYIDGSIMINLALLADFESEEEIAFVIAHELSHLILRHGITKAAKSKKISRAERSEILTKDIRSLSMEKYSQEAEFEADSLAVVLMAQSEYNPNGAIRALGNLGEVTEKKKMNKFAEIVIRILTADYKPNHAYIATHPKTADRVERVKRISNSAGTDATDAEEQTYLAAINVAMLKLLQEYNSSRSTIFLINKIDHLITTPAFYEDERQARAQIVRAEIIYDMYANEKESIFYYQMAQYLAGNLKKSPFNKGSYALHKFKDDGYQNWIQEQKEQTISILHELSHVPDALKLLGLFALEDNELSTCREQINTYLSMAPNSSDAYFYKHLLEEI